jgi:RNA polymerase sigma factor (sigma-70 family)
MDATEPAHHRSPTALARSAAPRGVLQVTRGEVVTTDDSSTGTAEPVVAVDLRDFATVYRELYPAMVRLAFLTLGDRRQAEEVTQDAFVAAYRRWSSIDAPGAYVRQSVTNGCRDALRRRRVAEALHIRRTAPEAVEPHEHVEDLLSKLSARQRLVVVLRFYEDQTVEQIAALLDTRPGTVKSLLHRALAELREDLER